MLCTTIPEFLYHKVCGGYTYQPKEDVIWAVDQIEKEGLIPLVATAWVNLVPERIRGLPIVWLTERIRSIEEDDYVQWLQITTDELDRSLLFKLDKSDVSWWVYQGEILPGAITLKG